jgi:hypothetical protein
VLTCDDGPQERNAGLGAGAADVSTTRLPNRSDEVDRFLAALDHPRRDEIETIRAIVLAADPAITERVKWNAPSFCHHGEDRVTFRLQPRNIVQLVFHRGAKTRSPEGFAFADPTGLLVWAAPDRATLTFAGMDEVNARRDALAGLVRAWIAATAPSPG